MINSPTVAVANGEEVEYVGAATVEEVFTEKEVSQEDAIGVLNMIPKEVVVRVDFD